MVADPKNTLLDAVGHVPWWATTAAFGRFPADANMDASMTTYDWPAHVERVEQAARRADG